MDARGFTLLELLATILVLTILLGVGLPQLSQQIQNNRTRTLTFDLLTAANRARALAVTRGTRVTMRTLGDHWHEGWEIFTDTNHNGVRDGDDEQLLVYTDAPAQAVVSANDPVSDYLSFLPTGESRAATGLNGGAWQGGTLTICSESAPTAYQLVLRRGGRMRMTQAGPDACSP